MSAIAQLIAVTALADGRAQTTAAASVSRTLAHRFDDALNPTE